MSKKKDETVYTIQITGEQIKTIRSVYMRIEQVYVHRGVAEIIMDDDKIERVSFFECYFCHKATYGRLSDIVHDKECIIPLAEKEFDALNGQFIKVLEGEKPND